MPRSLVLGTSILLILASGCSKPQPEPPVVMNTAEGDILGRTLPETPEEPAQLALTLESDNSTDATAYAATPAPDESNLSQDTTQPAPPPVEPADERSYMMTDFDASNGERFHYDRRTLGKETPVSLIIKENGEGSVLYMKILLSALLGDAAGSEVGSTRYIIRTDTSRYIMTKETPGLKTYSKTTDKGRIVWMEKRVLPSDREFLKRLSKSTSVRLEIHGHFKRQGTALTADEIKALANVWNYYGEITPR